MRTKVRDGRGISARGRPEGAGRAPPENVSVLGGSSTSRACCQTTRTTRRRSVRCCMYVARVKESPSAVHSRRYGHRPRESEGETSVSFRPNGRRRTRREITIDGLDDRAARIVRLTCRRRNRVGVELGERSRVAFTVAAAEASRRAVQPQRCSATTTRARPPMPRSGSRHECLGSECVARTSYYARTRTTGSARLPVQR